MVQASKKIRLTRESWLQQALEILAEDPLHLRVDEVARRLGVSKGSFYWHFESRSDFVLALAEFWRDHNTNTVAERVGQVQGSAEDRLYTLMKLLLEERLGRYDLAVRAWARHEPGILPVIREVDEIRLNTVTGIFLDMGFDDGEATMRARVFAVCHSLEDALSIPLTRQQARDQLEARHRFFTRR